MSELGAQLESLKAGWDSCKGQDDQKHSLITVWHSDKSSTGIACLLLDQELFACIENLNIKLSDAESELRDKRDVIKLTRGRHEEAEKQVQALQHEKDRHVFASVVIDGDGMPFKDELVKQGLEGGKRTASLLKQAVEEELQASLPSSAHHTQVVVRVYANTKGLAKTYKEMEILPESASLDDFVRGFNMGDVLCDYVDAGNGKECTDEKVKAIFQHDLKNVHCQRVFFGGTADNGYARLLGRFIEDDTARRQIILLEGPPFAYELADIKDRFRTVSFDKVFRSQKLLNIKRRVSFQPTPPSTPSMDYAKATTKALSAPVSTSASASKQDSAVPTMPTTGVLRNRLGQRVDSQLNYPTQIFNSVKNRKLCNSFYLLGRCPYQESKGKCSHDHHERLSASQFETLRAVARQSPCLSGLHCNDPNCLYGHRCTRSNCPRVTCKFPRNMHEVDLDIVS